MVGRNQKQGKGWLKDLVRGTTAWLITTAVMLVIMLMTAPIIVAITAGINYAYHTSLGLIVLFAYLTALMIITVLVLRRAVREVDEYPRIAREEINELIKWLMGGGGDDE